MVRRTWTQSTKKIREEEKNNSRASAANDILRPQFRQYTFLLIELGVLQDKFNTCTAELSIYMFFVFRR